MKKHRRTMLVIAIVAAVLAASFFTFLYRSNLPMLGELAKKGVIDVSYAPGSLELNADSRIWNDVEPAIINLYPQSARSPHGDDERVIEVRGVHNDDEIAFLLEFDDDTENRSGPARPDSCAILFTPADGPATTQMMGFGGMANVWQWLADMDTQQHQAGNLDVKAVRELIATGPGTQKPLGMQNVEAKGVYEGQRWRVVFKRSLNSTQDRELDFSSESNLNVAFALWNGEKMEASSRKSIAILRSLRIEGK